MITTDVITISLSDLIIGHTYRTTVVLQNPSDYYATLDRSVVEFIANATSKDLLFYLKKSADLKIVLLETTTVDLITGQTTLENSIWLCPTPSASPTAIPGETPGVTPTPTITPTRSRTPTPPPTNTQTPTQTKTPSPTTTTTKTVTPTKSVTPTPSDTPGYCSSYCSPADIAAHYGLSPLNGYASIRNDTTTVNYLQNIENNRGLKIINTSTTAQCEIYTGYNNYPTPDNSYHWYWNGSSWSSISAIGYTWLGSLKICKD